MMAPILVPRVLKRYAPRTLTKGKSNRPGTNGRGGYTQVDRRGTRVVSIAVIGQKAERHDNRGHRNHERQKRERPRRYEHVGGIHKKGRQHHRCRAQPDRVQDPLNNVELMQSENAEENDARHEEQADERQGLPQNRYLHPDRIQAENNPKRELKRRDELKERGNAPVVRFERIG